MVFIVMKYREMRIKFGEDLLGFWEKNNNWVEICGTIRNCLGKLLE